MAAPLFQSSGDLIADRRYAFARDLSARGDIAAAADVLAQAVERAAGFTAAWFALGEARETLGQHAEAIAAFRRASILDPYDRHGAHLRLMRLKAEPIGNMPPHYVREVFDQYAERFDDALVRGLAYRGPELLLATVQRARTAMGQPRRIGSLLDLGCGTGLGGAAFRPICDWLVGVDLSANMIAQARAKNLYDQLIVGDIVEFLATEEATAPFNLILAADVFAYFADIHTIIAAAALALERQGLLAFTVETHAGNGVILGDKLRFAYASAHVRSAIRAAGLTTHSIDPVSTRNEAGTPVPGLIAVASKP